MLEMYKSVAVMALFSYAAIMDIRYMRVPNTLWKVMLPLGVVFFGIELWQVPFKSWYILFGVVGLACIAAIVLFLTNYIGASDAKGIMLLSLFFPHWHGSITFLAIVVALAITLTLPVTLYYFYQVHVTKDIFEADKVRRHTAFFPYMLAGFVLALFITPIAV
jgi:Flp pilus assembly protein protease CpaA